ncbi:putative E3 ubiquitin-protein ligase RHA2B [Smittium mucronatum]|uniref:Putative E3 ubiquitin-protein ligase RHA2B n=1 Tax=Smittium mucronatum TaxID=133383 RepID=A0A1R0H3Q6_9FUNG|nr:putative E3 ubiquitin-protein ligase RHA2B [Smittium mucronatum]
MPVVRGLLNGVFPESVSSSYAPFNPLSGEFSSQPATSIAPFTSAASTYQGPTVKFIEVVLYSLLARKYLHSKPTLTVVISAIFVRRYLLSRSSANNGDNASNGGSDKSKNHLTKKQLEMYPVVPFSHNMVLNKHYLTPEPISSASTVASVISLPELAHHTQLDVDSEMSEKDCYDCTICFDSIQAGDDVRDIPCQHVFHSGCLDTWLTTRTGFCPTCRYNFLPQTE